MRSRHIIAFVIFSLCFVGTTFALQDSYPTELIAHRDETQTCHDASLEDECAVFIWLVDKNATTRVPFQIDLTREVWEDYVGTGGEEDDADEDYTGNMLIIGRSYVNDYEGDEKEPSRVFFTQEMIRLILPVSQTWTDNYYLKYRSPLVREMKKFSSYFIIDENGEYQYKNAKSEKQVQKFLKKYTLLAKKLEKMEWPEDIAAMKDKDATLSYKMYIYTSILRAYWFLE